MINIEIETIYYKCIHALEYDGWFNNEKIEEIIIISILNSNFPFSSLMSVIYKRGMILLKLKKFESGEYTPSQKGYSKIRQTSSRPDPCEAKISGSTHLVSYRVFAHKRVGQELCCCPPITGLLLEAGLDETAKLR